MSQDRAPIKKLDSTIYRIISELRQFDPDSEISFIGGIYRVKASNFKSAKLATELWQEIKPFMDGIRVTMIYEGEVRDFFNWRLPLKLQCDEAAESPKPRRGRKKTEPVAKRGRRKPEAEG